VRFFFRLLLLFFVCFFFLLGLIESHKKLQALKCLAFEYRMLLSLQKKKMGGKIYIQFFTTSSLFLSFDILFLNIKLRIAHIINKYTLTNTNTNTTNKQFTSPYFMEKYFRPSIKFKWMSACVIEMKCFQKGWEEKKVKLMVGRESESVE
jgi:hypothetical protein